MEIIEKDGDLLESNVDVIAHQVNCLGVMGSGIALQIRNRYPELVYDKYVSKCHKEVVSRFLLGECQICEIPGENRYVANLFGQVDFGRQTRNTSYDGIYDAMEKLRSWCTKNGVKSVGFPYKMSSDRGGADWNVIMSMIESVFGNTDIRVEIWKFNHEKH